MRAIISVVEQLEQLEDQLQAMKWAVRSFPRSAHPTPPRLRSAVTNTAGLLRGHLPQGSAYQRRLRREWELRLKREHA